MHINENVVKEILNRVFTNSIKTVNDLKETLHKKVKEENVHNLITSMKSKTIFNEKKKFIEDSHVFLNTGIC
jgi:hypothetical protein